MQGARTPRRREAGLWSTPYARARAAAAAVQGARTPRRREADSTLARALPRANRPCGARSAPFLAPICSDLDHLHRASRGRAGAGTGIGNPNSTGSGYHVKIWGKLSTGSFQTREGVYFPLLTFTYKSFYNTIFTPTTTKVIRFTLVILHVWTIDSSSMHAALMRSFSNDLASFASMPQNGKDEHTKLCQRQPAEF